MTGRRRGLAAAIAVLLLGSGLAGCGGSVQADYCSAVKSRQSHLSAVLGEGGNAALLQALPTFRELQDKAPEDIRDDWKTVVDRLTALQRALAAAGVEAQEYDAKHPPADVTASQRRAIADAATKLGSTATVTALNAVQQHARDVCHTPLSL